MGFQLRCPNPESGEEYDWEIECATIQEAERSAQDPGMLVSPVEVLSGTEKVPDSLFRFFPPQRNDTMMLSSAMSRWYPEKKTWLEARDLRRSTMRKSAGSPRT